MQKTSNYSEQTLAAGVRDFMDITANGHKVERALLCLLPSYMASDLEPDPCERKQVAESITNLMDFIQALRQASGKEVGHEC